MLSYTVTFTDLARGFATKVGGISAVEEQARGEISEMMHPDKEHGLEDISGLLMHVVTMKDNKGDNVEFICQGLSDGGLLIDTATYEELDEVMQDGPFKGYKIMMPRRDSDDNEHS